MPSRLTYVLVWIALLVLLAMTMGVAQLHLGIWNPLTNLAIAVIKTVLIAWFFMHLHGSPSVVRLFALGMVLWLAILFGLALPDWLTR